MLLFYTLVSSTSQSRPYALMFGLIFFNLAHARLKSFETLLIIHNKGTPMKWELPNRLEGHLSRRIVTSNCSERNTESKMKQPHLCRFGCVAILEWPCYLWREVFWNIKTCPAKWPFRDQIDIVFTTSKHKPPQTQHLLKSFFWKDYCHK